MRLDSFINIKSHASLSGQAILDQQNVRLFQGQLWLRLWETNSKLQALYILLACKLLFHLSLFSTFFWSVLALEWGDIKVVDAIWEENIFEK